MVFRGYYPTREEAEAACPKEKPTGYNQEVLATHPEPSQLTARQSIGGFDRRDYPLLFWLARVLGEGRTVFDLGGNVGLGYYAYERFISYPAGLSWLVCEISQICKRGELLAKERGITNLTFTEDFSLCENRDLLITCGTLQCLPWTLGSLVAKLKAKPRHILIHRVPLTEGPTFYTVQNIGYAFAAYRFQGKGELFDSLTALGYKLIDSWKDSREAFIPFHRERSIQGYSGAYFKLDASA